jgi:hypothetical protein
MSHKGQSTVSLQDFRSDFSRSAFRTIDGELAIIGKFGRIIEFDDGTFDCWFVGSDLERLSGRRIASIRRNLAQEGTFQELTGEAWVQGQGREFVLKIAPLLGIKRKRQVSPKTAEHLAKLARTQKQIRGYAA